MIMVNKEQLDILRHSAAHVLAAAVKSLFPSAKLGIGPATEDGFYYDFKFEIPISEDDLARIEEEMRSIIKEGLPITKSTKDRTEAIEFFNKLNETYKVDLINEIQDSKVSFYTIGNNRFVDLCRGPHLENTSQIKAFKLLSIAGAYWKGDEHNDMLTRIYGTAFFNDEELEEYLRNIEEAKKRDHRAIAKKLKLFMLDQEVGQGLPIWMPRGAHLRYETMKFAYETYINNGYMPLSTPHIASTNLWRTSGHIDFYKENMYPTFNVDENEEYVLKPMNCPLHIKVFSSETRSYKDLPMRYTEMGTVYRYEKQGELHGLLRTRGFTQDDAHIICSEEQLEKEIRSVLDLTFYIFKTFGMYDFEITISLDDPAHPEKYIGDREDWDKASECLKNAVKKSGYTFKEEIGEAAFYGPKIDIIFRDVLKRKRQLSTIQVDFNLPKRFDMKYIGKDGKEHIPFMIHRALLGSLERFLGILIEQYAGNLPLWLQYEKVRIIPINEKSIIYAEDVRDKLTRVGILTKIDDKNEPINGKIKSAEEEKIPYILIIGDKEKSTDSVSVRLQGVGNIGLVNLNEFVEKIVEEIETRSVKSLFIA